MPDQVQGKTCNGCRRSGSHGSHKVRDSIERQSPTFCSPLRSMQCKITRSFARHVSCSASVLKMQLLTLSTVGVQEAALTTSIVKMP